MRLSYGRDLLIQWTQSVMRNRNHCGEGNILCPDDKDLETTLPAPTIRHMTRMSDSMQVDMKAEAEGNEGTKNVHQAKREKTNLKPVIIHPRISLDASKSKQQRAHASSQPEFSVTIMTEPGSSQQDVEVEPTAAAIKPTKIRKSVTWASDVPTTPELLLKQVPEQKKKKKRAPASPPAKRMTRSATRAAAAAKAATQEAQRVKKVTTEQNSDSGGNSRVAVTGRGQKPGSNRKQRKQVSPNVDTPGDE